MSPIGQTIGAVLGSIFAIILKAILGTDKPTSYEVRQATPDKPLPGKSDAELLGELGLKKES
jgi:hypothetical protein